MEATAQLNARMSKSLKESGDEALALIGFSPTQAVRALWEKASRRGKDLEEVEALLRGVGAEEEPVTAPDASLQAMWDYMDEVYRSLGIDPTVKYDMPSDKELLEEALCERMVERGLM